MGALCSCFNVADLEERGESSISNHRNCRCPNCLMQSLKYKCEAFFGGVETHPAPPIESVASSSSALSPNILQFDANSNVMMNMKSENSKSLNDLASEGKNLPSTGQYMRRRINLQTSSRLVIEDESKVPHWEDDEDVCPTCFEEYTLENPKIVIQCHHGYHLGCIYEWMERSEKCPICGRLMLFN